MFFKKKENKKKMEKKQAQRATKKMKNTKFPTHAYRLRSPPMLATWLRLPHPSLTFV